MSGRQPSSGKQPAGGPPATPPSKARLRVKGKWKDVDVEGRVKKAGFDWVMYVDDDDGLETWYIV